MFYDKKKLVRGIFVMGVLFFAIVFANSIGKQTNNQTRSTNQSTIGNTNQAIDEEPNVTVPRCH